MPPEHFLGESVQTHSTADSAAHATLVDEPTSYEDTKGTGAFEPFLSSAPDDDDILSQIHISGSPYLRERLVALCLEFRSLFSNTLSPIPAKLKPFKLKVDMTKWEVPANRAPPRRLSPEKQFEVQKQISELLASGIIEKSDASFYSQILLVPKPGTNLWRLCVD